MTVNGSELPLSMPGLIPGSKYYVFVMEFVRKYDHFRKNIIIPLYILSIMAIISFLIPPKSGERIGYVITIQLALTFISKTVEEESPPSGDFPQPKILSFVTYVTIICILSMMETIGYLHLAAIIYGKGRKKIIPIGQKGDKVM